MLKELKLLLKLFVNSFFNQSLHHVISFRRRVYAILGIGRIKSLVFTMHHLGIIIHVRNLIFSGVCFQPCVECFYLCGDIGDLWTPFEVSMWDGYTRLYTTVKPQNPLLFIISLILSRAFFCISSCKTLFVSCTMRLLHSDKADEMPSR